MTAQPLVDYIKRHVDLTEDEEEILLSKVLLRRYKKGQYIVQQGDICAVESFVLKGCTKTYHTDAEGQDHIIMFSIENWWTADIGSFISQGPADYSLECLEDTELAQFTFAKLEEVCKEVPKMERMFRLIMQNALVAAQKRIVNNLSLSAKDRFLAFRETYPEMEQRIPQYMLASYLGMSKEFLSKVKSQLAHSS